jgi:CTP:molybdopterin cytidylyltransferase MocA
LNSKKVIDDRPAVVILAAGLAERMDRPKHTLKFTDEESFLDHIIHIYRRFVVSGVVLVVNKYFKAEATALDDSIKRIVNSHLEYGRFWSIQLGLNEIENKPVFIQNIDNPFVNLGLLMDLYFGLTSEDFAIPVCRGNGGHPVLLSSKIIPAIINNYKSDSHFNDVLKSFKRKDVMVKDPYITVNINTPEDYGKYFTGLMEH